MGPGALGAVGGRGIRWLAVAVLAAMVVAMLPPAAGTARSATDGRLVSVIVQARPGGLTSAAREVERFGGRVGRRLQVINGFTAQLPAGQVAGLSGGPSVALVTADEPVQMQAAAYAPTTDAGSL
jgi:hypothetical protein